MATPYIVVGCPTTGGGQVLSGNSMFLIEGIPIACVGDKATCPKHKTVATIISGDPHMQIFGKAAARVNDSLSCGCKLLPKQSLVVQDSGSGTVSSAARQSSSFQPNQQEQTISSLRDDKYENYYIQQEQTEYVKFKTFLFPYDEDKKGFIGMAMQAMSGACTFIVTRKITGNELFVTATLIPPVLKGDATIYPTASIKLSKKGEQIGKVQKLTIGKGFWNTENDKQPVGSCTIQLPSPDLQTIDVHLEVGYEAKLDGGVVVPNPRYTTHKFIINSATRQKA
ncbi:hypothetical protein F971_02009 [Acinetobacter vivianii]|uniref:PAAR domain-containing protein n=1 Tax=Acinetobacter vivianii TaxID=1776742 RepID=N8W9Z3_9GAMM|nr:PAAR domain-containing protein [Acinetobacter vivianii]ENU92122.1 hypothetical protein F971_02009 [Acinetobacter vivianii]